MHFNYTQNTCFSYSWTMFNNYASMPNNCKTGIEKLLYIVYNQNIIKERELQYA